MKNEKIYLRGVFLVILVMFLFFSTGIVLSESNDEIEVSVDDAESCLNESESILNEMRAEGFNIQRVNDTLRQGREVFERQFELFENEGDYDFEAVLRFCDTIVSIKEDAFITRDEFNSLMNVYNDTFTSDRIDTGSVDEILLTIESEIDSERYERVLPLIESAYAEISEVESRHTALILFYDATTGRLKRFFMNNWLKIILSLVGIFIMYIVLRKPFLRYWIGKKIDKLELRKKTLRGILEKNQTDYFDKGKISEVDFKTKNKKIGELVRDVERKLPLLTERLSKLGSKRKNDGS